MKKTTVVYKTACQKNLPWVDWYMHKGLNVKCGVVWTRQNKYKYIVIKSGKVYVAGGPLEAEYIAEN